IFNKLDAMPAELRPVLLQDTYEWDGQPVPRLFVSARAGEGLPALRQSLTESVLAAKGADKIPDNPADL
ncbi:MAG: GTPase HflX, partial [Comamonas sp.]